MPKLKLALYWASACGGCDVAVLDVNEKILDVAALADIVLWPVATDFKYRDVEAMPDKSIDVCLFNGAIRSTEHEHIAKMLRAKTKVMVAFGSCACFGGIPSLGNLSNREEIFNVVYKETPSTDNPGGVIPQRESVVEGHKLTLSENYDTVYSLEQIMPVEYFVPGCPPTVDQILKVVTALATNALPAPGSFIASNKSLCDECYRKKEDKKITKLYRIHQIKPDPERCLLEQGVVCCGPATRGGCGAQCIKANMPCEGCFGPPPGVIDQASKLVSAISSIYQANDEKDVKRMVEEMVDPVGRFSRFVMSNSLLRRKRMPLSGAPDSVREKQQAAAEVTSR